MTKLPLSVFIIAKDEQDRIPATINSVINWVAEVIVVISDPADATVAVAEKLGAKVIFNNWHGYGPQKVFGEKNCKNDWVLNLDADEEITPKLAEEIKNLFKPEPSFKAYRLKIHALYNHQKKLPLLPAGTTQVRLYNRKFAGFKDSTVHDSVVLNNGVAEKTLSGSVIHRSFRSYAHMMDKINSYTTMQAEDLFARGKYPSTFKIIYTPFLFFLKCYFLKRYIFYGIEGFTHAWIYSAAKTLRLAKARELFWKNK